MLWSEYWPVYIERYSIVHHRPNTTDLHRLCCKRLAQSLGNKPLDDLDESIVDGFQAERRRDGVSNRTINIELRVLSKALRIAVRWKLLCRMPFERIDILSEGPERVRKLDTKSRERLLGAVLDGHHGELILFFLASGLRRNECKFLEWKHVDFEQRGVFIPNSKSGRPRFVPLGDSGMTVIRQRLINRRLHVPYVFFNPQSEKPWADLTHMLKKDLRRAGLIDWRLHDLRHAYASHLHDKGANQFDLMSLLGHSSTASTRRYVHPGRDRMDSLFQGVDIELKQAAEHMKIRGT